MAKVTPILRDSFGREHTYLRISLIEKCNLRCTYCMPLEGISLTPREQLMTAQEIVDIATIFVNNGVTKIRLTGGEPILRKDFKEILEGLSELDVQLSITTNAILVDRHINTFIACGLQDINVSLDSLVSDKFATITKRDQFQKAYENIGLLMDKGFNVKVNVVLIKGFNEDEIIDFITLTKELPASIRFIEFMPFDGNRWDKSKLVTQSEILKRVHSHFGIKNCVPLENESNFTARNFKIRGFKSSFGIISSVSNPFCDSCNRIRLTANGKLKNCLFSNGEMDLLSRFRESVPIEPFIQQAIGKKKKTRAGMETMQQLENPQIHSKNRSMITIGG